MEGPFLPIPDHLMRSLEQSRIWLQSSGARGKAVYLAYETWPRLDLRDAIFVEALLQEADLSEGCLDRVDAARCVANGIRLARASLIDSIWLRAEMEGADLTEARADNACFKRARLINACLRSCRLRGANMLRATCLDADFSGAVLVDVDLSTALLGGANLAQTDLTGARLDGCFIDEKTCLNGAVGVERTVVSHLFSDKVGRLEGKDAMDLLLRIRERPISQ